jgi:DNA-binding Lrp family transcriptional regulator
VKLQLTAGSIAELQRDGRLSNVELADRIGLTPAPCLRRVKRLESDGVILGYTARINPEAIGRGSRLIPEGRRRPS